MWFWGTIQIDLKRPIYSFTSNKPKPFLCEVMELENILPQSNSVILSRIACYKLKTVVHAFTSNDETGYICVSVFCFRFIIIFASSQYAYYFITKRRKWIVLEKDDSMTTSFSFSIMLAFFRRNIPQYNFLFA